MYIQSIPRKEFAQLSVTLYALSIYTPVHNQLSELFSRDGLYLSQIFVTALD